MSIKIGVIAEDVSDVQVVSELLSKYIDKNKFSVKHFVGQGCGKLKAKCGAWVENLCSQGCSHIFLFHDLDRNNEATLRADLNKRLSKCAFDPLVVIPTEELEAWLLADMEAIKSVFSISEKIKPIHDVESVPSPKEYLQRLIKRNSNKNYVNTIHNRKIAEKMQRAKLAECTSYLPFEKYLLENFEGIVAAP